MSERGNSAMENAGKANTESAAAENNEVGRRRSGALKRKNSGASGPSKRLAKERDKSTHGPFSNGSAKPRQSPIKSAAKLHLPLPEISDSVLAGKPAPTPTADTLAAQNLSKESNVNDKQASLLRNWELADEVLRDKNAHIVPNPTGWFSWGEIHAVEKHGVPSFFNKKSDTRNPETYLDIRNAIIKRFHNCPSKLIGFSDVSDIASEDEDAVREIMEFLDHWGLINFCPLRDPQEETLKETSNGEIGSKEIQNEKDTIDASTLLENLYSFQKLDQRHLTKPSETVISRAFIAPVLAEPVISDTLMRAQGPAVEYHCNYCSADCSTKRYHCQKQADFDLCPDCYNAQRFGPGMVSTDFLLMEPVRVGMNSSSWTDQETLLLLEALELYGNNWNEIAEHVATKSKAQCILHFIRLPIEDPFFEDGDPSDTTEQTNMETVSASKEVAATAPQSTSNSSVTKGPSSEEHIDGTTNEVRGNENVSGCPSEENDATKALMAALHAFGGLLGSERSMSFAEAGNPVMTLVAFLAGIVGPQVASYSAQKALNALSDQMPSLRLAARHSFQLDDPPSDVNNLTKTQTGTEILSEHGTALQPGKEGDDGLPQKASDSVPPEIPKETDILEAETSSKVAVAPVGETDSVASEKNAGSADKENAKSSNESCKEGDADAEDSRCVDKLADTLDKKCVEDSVKTENSTPPDLTKCSNDNKLSEDQVEAKSHSTTKDKDENKLSENSVDRDEAHSCENLTRAAVTILSAASVKAKILANKEEEEIQNLAADVINHQLRKLEIKLRNLQELESALVKQRELIERAKQRLLHERSQILVSRLGSQGSFPRFSSPLAVTNASAVAPAPSRFTQNFKPGSAKPPIFPSTLKRFISSDSNLMPGPSTTLYSPNQPMPYTEGASSIRSNPSLNKK